jgi:lipopolysaccharide export system protein LptA
MAMTPDRKTAGQRPPSDSKVHLLHADCLYFDERLHRTAQILVGHVQFSHDGVLLFCDSALYYESTNSFDAFGHVRMNQGDTLMLNSEVLYYNGLDQLARARYDVELEHGTMTIYTDSLDFDRLYNLGYYFEGGRVLDHDNELTSDWGEYNPTTHEAVFNYNVRLVNPAPPAKPETVLISDTLHYNTETAIAHIVGPSNIENGDNHIYSECGYYDTQKKHSHLLERSILTNNGKRLVGDSVVWNDDVAIAEAYGDIIYTDEVNKNMFTGEYCYYEDITGYVMATDSAVAIDYSQQDTMYAHADTFKVFTYNIDTDSTYRIVHAYYHMRAFRKDVQAVCDSMVYDTRDSILIMYRDPILWQAGQQQLGEEIRIFFNGEYIDSVQVLRQALSVEKIDSIHYNQVAGREMHTYFKDGEIYLSTSEGNVFVNYYPFDDDSIMVELNHTETSLLKMYVKERKVDRIWMPAATGVMYPIPLIPSNMYYLENFAWFDYIRPIDRYDIFEWRPKKAGSELKESVRHSAPKQKLSDIRKQRGITSESSESPESPDNTEAMENLQALEPSDNSEHSESPADSVYSENSETNTN